MKRAWFFFVVFFTLSQGEIARASNPGDSVFAGIQVHTIDIQFPRSDYWDSLTIYYDEGNEQNIPATVVLDGVTYDSVGVRFKGHSSYSHPNNKKPFRLSFDEYLSSQRWDGMKSVHLNNCWEDPTFMREKVHLDFCREAGIAAPRANFALLYINDTLFGFYSLVEHVDKKFLSSRFGNNGGNLFKAVDGYGDTTDLFSDFVWRGSDTSAYTDYYEMKTDGSTTAWNQLVQFLDTLNNSSSLATSLANVADLSTLYKAIAADILFANLDSYVCSGRNFYFYFNPTTTKMDWIVWDVGLSFGGYPSSGVSSAENLSLTYMKDTAARPLFNKIVQTPALKSAYLNTLCSLNSGYFSQAQLFPHIDSIANVIRPYVYEDPRKMYTNEQFETNITSDITVSSGRKPGLQSFITLREANVQTQLSKLSVSCTASASRGDVVINEFMAMNDSIFDPAGEADPWIELYNATADTIDLGGMYLSDVASDSTTWQFPTGSSIAPEGFLIVWADSDSGQSGIHANIALSAKGGYLRLSNTDASLLDSVTYGVQTAHYSMARIPNGTGSFVQTKPTFDTTNVYAVESVPALTEVLFPQYIEGINNKNTNRIPCAYRLKLTGLLSNATYRFFNQIVTSADSVGTDGAGNCIFVSTSGSFIRSTGPSLSTSGGYGTFAADSTGAYEGWFATEPTGNERFIPGKYIFVRIALNDGAAGDSVSQHLTSTDSIRVVKLDTTVSDSTGTGLRCTSGASARDFVFVYDDTAGTGRPISGSFVESDGSDNSTSNKYASFYGTSVNGVGGAFGMVLPNALSNGIRRIEQHALATGATVAIACDDDGVWPSGANTVNPSGGTSAIVLAASDVSLVTDVRENTSAPTAFELSQNYPNPFNPSTNFQFSIASCQLTILRVYDVLGREVATLVNDVKQPGRYSVRWDASNLPSGVYFYRLEAGCFVDTKKLLLMR